MRIVCWQTILMRCHTLFFFRKLGKMSQNLSSAAVVIDALRVNSFPADNLCKKFGLRCYFFEKVNFEIQTDDQYPFLYYLQSPFVYWKCLNR